MEDPLAHGNSNLQAEVLRNPAVPAAFLFTISSAFLMLMSAMEPRLALPLAAFALMASLTCVLGKRLFRDFTGTSGRTD
ncbi:MAG: hypothetical protein Tsb0019_20110 [Roseibium sp.]